MQNTGPRTVQTRGFATSSESRKSVWRNAWERAKYEFYTQMDRLRTQRKATGYVSRTYTLSTEWKWRAIAAELMRPQEARKVLVDFSQRSHRKTVHKKLWTVVSGRKSEFGFRSVPAL